MVSVIETEVAVGIHFKDLNEVSDDDSVTPRSLWRMP